AVIVQPHNVVDLLARVPADEDLRLIYGRTVLVLLARDFIDLEVLMCEHPFGVDVVRDSTLVHLTGQHPLAGEMIDQRIVERCLLREGRRGREKYGKSDGRSHVRNVPPVAVATAATTFCATASISTSVSVLSLGARRTEMASDFLPSGTPLPS